MRKYGIPYSGMLENKNLKITKGVGFTPAERYLKTLCEKSFLSLWSYPNVFRKQAKELCDLLVVFGDDIFIFSDKYCIFPNSGNLDNDWKKWFRRGVANSAEQLWGAERWLRGYPDRIFLDAKCQKKFPIEIIITEKTRFHLILVTHGVSKVCASMLGGSGSMMLKSDLKGIEQHTESFTIGDLEPSKTFVHVLDDTTLDILMDTRDTVIDFTEYLVKKELFFRSGIKIISAGEEEMLATYLKDLNKEGEHDFVLPREADGRDKSLTGIFYDEGGWEAYRKSTQRLAQIEENKASYLWDSLIETFNEHALAGTQYYVSSGGINDTEKTLRFMAKESRFMRRMYAQNLEEILRTTPKNIQRIRVITPTKDFDRNPYYVFLLFPIPDNPPVEETEYRKLRQIMLEAVCLVTRLKYPEAKHIIGIATESGLDNNGRSEDAMYLDGSHWNAGIEESAKKAQKELKILISPTTTHYHGTEYPIKASLSKNPRNKPCPCGSKKKYKYCHGKS